MSRSSASFSAYASLPSPVEPSLSPDEEKDYKSPNEFKCAVVTALVEELAPVIILFEKEFAQLPRQTGDNNKYYFGCIKNINLIATTLPMGTYGNVKATDACKDLLRSFPSVEHIFMVGIAGICNVELLQLGDVVIGNGEPVEFDIGKESIDGFKSAALAVGDARGAKPLPSKFLLNIASNLVVKTLTQKANHFNKSLQHTLAKIALVNKAYAHPDIDDLLYSRNPNNQAAAATSSSSAAVNIGGGSFAGVSSAAASAMILSSNESAIIRSVRDTPNIEFGVIATGEKVIKNAALRDDLHKTFNALCVEMEAAGVAEAAQSKFLIIRGMCDYADSHKNDRWHKYAAATAAAVFREVLKCMPPLEEWRPRTSSLVAIPHSHSFSAGPLYANPDSNSSTPRKRKHEEKKGERDDHHIDELRTPNSSTPCSPKMQSASRKRSSVSLSESSPLASPLHSPASTTVSLISNDVTLRRSHRHSTPTSMPLATLSGIMNSEESTAVISSSATAGPTLSTASSSAARQRSRTPSRNRRR